MRCKGYSMTFAGWVCVWTAVAVAAVDQGGLSWSTETGAGCPAACECDKGLELWIRCGNLTVTAQSRQYAKFQCEPGTVLRVSDVPLLTSLEGAPLPSASFDSCAPPAAGWSAALRALGPAGAAKLTIRAAPLHALSADSFSDSVTLDALTIVEPEPAGPWSPSPALLTALPGLRRLITRGVHVHLPPDTFINAPPLTRLDLNLGSLNLQRGSFRGLSNVTLLVLFKNELTELPDDALEGLHSLEELELSANELSVLSAGSLRGAPLLKKLNVMSNPLERLEAGALAECPLLEQLTVTHCRATLALGAGALAALPALRDVKIEQCGVRELHSDTFSGSRALGNLSLAGNALEALPATLLRDLTGLRRLDLSHNRISSLHADVFVSLSSLQELNIDGNILRELPDGLFFGCVSLERVSAGGCGLTAWRAGAWRGAAALRRLVLRNNSLALSAAAEGAGAAGALEDELGVYSPLHELRALTHLDLAHNRLSAVAVDWRLSLSLTHLDLSSNHITYLQDADLDFVSDEITVDLRYNKITTVDILSLPDAALASNDSEVKARGPLLMLDHNPFRCDCRLYKFLNRIRTHSRGPISKATVSTSTAQCASPQALSGTELSRVPLSELRCALPPPACPAACRCELRPADRALELRCAALPPAAGWPSPRDYGLNSTEVRLLEAPGGAVALPAHVARLDLSGLGLRAAPALQPAPAGLRLLDLRHNLLPAAPRSLLPAPHRLRLRLAGNPLQCDCDDLQLLNKYNATVEDWSEVECVESGGERVRVSAARCGGGRGALLAAAGALLVAAAAAAAALYYRYERHVKVWLWARGCCPAWTRDSEPDEEARYDVFVSYSHVDEAWVAGELVPALECGARPLRVCLHHRDWVAGDWIPAQIARSVAQSRRTLVVLSDSFVRSVWGRLEWRAAHVRAMRERRARVLVVLLDDVQTNELEPELRAYLATNTYLRRDDPAFWDKLRYALPTPPPALAAAPRRRRRLAALFRRAAPPVLASAKPQFHAPDQIVVAEPVKGKF